MHAKEIKEILCYTDPFKTFSMQFVNSRYMQRIVIQKYHVSSNLYMQCMNTKLLVSLNQCAFRNLTLVFNAAS